MDQLAQALQAILQQQSQQMELQQQQFGEMLDKRDQEARAAQEAAQRRFEQEIQQRQQHARQLYEQRQQQFEEQLAHHQQKVRRLPCSNKEENWRPKLIRGSVKTGNDSILRLNRP